ncbi:MAG: site-2 protease family protein, partial [Chloroflexota bacterium]|nr:site-2 protease family protein [Chloroflexota bacterium]
PAEFSDWPTSVYWITGAATAIMLFVSVLLHELAHSVVARNDKMVVTNITLFIFGGVSQIAAEPPSAATEFRMAAVGPLTSFGLAIIFLLLQPVVSGFAPLLAMARYLTYINLSLGAFNLIPGFPLDGGRVLRSLVWSATRSFSRATMVAGNVGRFIAYGFILLGVWQIVSGSVGNGLWIAFIGWFLESAASAQVQQQALQDLMAGHKVSEAMTRGYTAIPADTTLQHLVDDYILKTRGRSFVVTEGEKPVGMVTMHCVRDTPREQWAATSVAQCMMPVADLKRVKPEDELWSALQEMDRDGVNQLPVMNGGVMLGMLSRDDVITYLRTRKELGLLPR